MLTLILLPSAIPTQLPHLTACELEARGKERVQRSVISRYTHFGVYN